MIGDSYRSAAVQAVLGPAHAEVIPAVLWLGWLDGDGDLIAMSGTSVLHDVWEPTDDGVTNTAVVDAGVAGTGWEIHKFAFFDAAEDGEPVLVSDELDEPLTPDEGAALSFDVGALVAQVAS